ncbi:Predicted DNA-binding transcriptional regulator YafY, contains an HTH and WYL domains [Arthrobacter alpinus]|uniref:Predicted DNA-binding transcriptional regulator YafY, contains an HTH and WYL domains n=1 Tax=Arthrobacter alpinus TaxID=656366 RepID=A0A1H5I479_9MICC|nr:WYL domain-containing protein [Arthrobacter alpinus]SEE35017.1 Predicted DNA-binding transcriptional regulator YafY, contains an HTH and WYL domains [Arthrobacter alpinus]
MKSQRLLSMMLLLQTRHQMTAADLADELDVSVRTILRDVTTLADADVPVFAERGRYGGVVLLPGSQLDVSKLSMVELDALKLLGLDPGQARQLGVDAATRTAHRKLASRRPLAGHSLVPLSELVNVDNMPWFSPETQGASVADLGKDLQFGRRLRILYRSSAERDASWRTVDPYGLLAKAGRWYLVADIDGSPRLYSQERVQSWEVLAEDRCLRQGESLASVSRHLSATVEHRGGITVTALLSLDRVDLARRILGSRLTSSKPLDAGRVEITIAYDQVEAVRQLLQFGANLHVTSPPEAQAVMRDVATATSALYQG